MKSKKAILFLSCLFFLLTAFAQFPTFTGFTDTLHSNILNEDREIYISLPAKAADNPNLRFPVLYLFDGELYFQTATLTVRHLSETNGNSIIPDMIVVAISNTNRFRDLTPTEDTLSGLPVTGGGEMFTAYLQQELIPHIENTYPTAPYRLLVGHSLGGLMVVNTLLKHTELFDAYIAIDPAVWWQDMLVNQEAEALLQSKKLADKRLYLAIANSLPPGMEPEQAMKDTSVSSFGYRAAVLFEQELQENKKSLLTWSSKYYPDESHGSVPMLGLYDGLKAIFNYYKRPSYSVLSDSTVHIIENHYQMLSQKMGYDILPPQNSLLGLAWRCRALDKNMVRAFSFLALAKKYYPESSAVYYDTAEWYKEKGDMEQVEKLYEKAKALDLEKN